MCVCMYVCVYVYISVCECLFANFMFRSLYVLQFYEERSTIQSSLLSLTVSINDMCACIQVASSSGSSELGGESADVEGSSVKTDSDVTVEHVEEEEGGDGDGEDEQDMDVEDDEEEDDEDDDDDDEDEEEGEEEDEEAEEGEEGAEGLDEEDLL